MFDVVKLREISERKPVSGYTTRYGALREEFPRYYLCFNNMIERAQKYNLECLFERNKEDLIQFMCIIGEVPKDMFCPTVGRYNHSKGYVFDSENNRWNFRWQEKSENSREMGKRVKTGFQVGNTIANDPDHISQKTYLCPYCGKTGQGLVMYRDHFDNCKKRYIHLIQDMKHIEYPQMILSFGG
jgi:hypothetical protein